MTSFEVFGRFRSFFFLFVLVPPCLTPTFPSFGCVHPFECPFERRRPRRLRSHRPGAGAVRCPPASAEFPPFFPNPKGVLRDFPASTSAAERAEARAAITEAEYGSFRPNTFASRATLDSLASSADDFEKLFGSNFVGPSGGIFGSHAFAAFSRSDIAGLLTVAKIPGHDGPFFFVTHAPVGPRGGEPFPAFSAELFQGHRPNENPQPWVVGSVLQGNRKNMHPPMSRTPLSYASNMMFTAGVTANGTSSMFDRVVVPAISTGTALSPRTDGVPDLTCMWAVPEDVVPAGEPPLIKMAPIQVPLGLVLATAPIQVSRSACTAFSRCQPLCFSQRELFPLSAWVSKASAISLTST